MLSLRNDGEPSCYFAGVVSKNKNCRETSAMSSSDAECTYLVNTRKKTNKRCHSGKAPSSSSNGVFDLLVTGIGGSGTNLVASSLRRLGVTIGHEYIEVCVL
jgi:hypothetical protein